MWVNLIEMNLRKITVEIRANDFLFCYPLFLVVSDYIFT